MDFPKLTARRRKTAADSRTPKELQAKGAEIAQRLQGAIPGFSEEVIGPDGEPEPFWFDLYGSDEFHEILGRASYSPDFQVAVQRVIEHLKHAQSLAQALVNSVNPDSRVMELEIKGLLKGPLALKHMPDAGHWAGAPKARMCFQFRWVNAVLLRARENLKKNATRDTALEQIGKRSSKAKSLIANHADRDHLLEILIGTARPEEIKQTESPTRWVAAVLVADNATAEGMKISPATLLRWIVDSRS